VPTAFLDLVRGADPAGFWIALLAAAVIGSLLLHRGVAAFWRLRLIHDTPTARVRSAPQGYVELIGQARPLRSLVAAKLTGIPCCWYRWRIERRRRSGRSQHWETVEHGELERPFLLDDGTGECVVDPGGAALSCRTTERWLSRVRGGGRAVPSALGMLFGLGGHYRMTEERIAEGDLVYVLGYHETPRRGTRERDQLVRQLLSQWKRDPQRREQFDRDGDGDLDRHEWEHARVLAQELAQRAEREVASQPVRARIGATGDSRRPYLLSTAGEAALVGQSRWQALGGTLAGAVLVIGVLAALAARFGAVG
jgi:hypothetical protein